MNPLKTAFAILASVMLVAMQTVFAVQPIAPTKSQACGCCSCHQLNCCVAQPTSAPRPVPGTPFHTVSQNNLFIATMVSLLLDHTETAPKKISFSPSASLKMTAGPLFQWNCSYLI